MADWCDHDADNDVNLVEDDNVGDDGHTDNDGYNNGNDINDYTKTGVKTMIKTMALTKRYVNVIDDNSNNGKCDVDNDDNNIML